MSSAACKDRHGITEPEVLSGVAVFVSDPATRPALAQHQRGAQAGDHVAAARTAETEVVYVSLPPGSFPDGVAATVRNERTGGIATAVMSDGGFDPIALEATAGDVLQFEIHTGGDGSNTVRFERSVPAKRRPVVVRTNPPRGKRDVPLNARIEVVFSEPIDSRTITAGSVRLVRGTTTVPARLEFTDAAGLMLALVPEQLLETSTTYAVVVSDAVRDLDGDPLEQTVSVEFVTESVTSGSVRLTTVTTGSDIDPDGYAIAGDFLADQVNPPIGPNSTVTIPNVPPGQRYVWLVGVSENCTVKGQQQRAVTVAAGATSPVVFEIECVATTAMRITAGTSGADLDTDGYTAQVQRTGFDRHVTVPVNGSATTAGLLFGEFLVTLSGVSANCDVSGPNPRVITVPGGGGTTEVNFSIGCAPATLIAYSGSPIWNPDGSPYNRDIYVVKSNGTDTRRLTTHPAADVEPDWSPDGGRIAFRSDRDGNDEIYVMNADGSAQTRLTSHSAPDYEPAWSPDGSRIAFVSERDGNPEIYVMNVDGSNPVRLTNNDGADVSPAWAPDGSKIAFRSERLAYGPGNGEIVLMNADGSGAARLTTDGPDDTGPAWSPDGSRIAFSRFIACEQQFGEEVLCQSDIFVMNADGSGVTRVAGVKRFFYWGYYADDEKNPAWSPDGRKIAIGATTCVSDGHCHLSSGITAVTLGAPGYVDVTAGHAFPVAPAWRRGGQP